MHKELNFKPLPFITGPHTQTLVSCFLFLPISPPSVTEVILLADHDKLAMEVSTPKSWSGKDPTVILIHGLGSDHKSPNLMRMAHKLYKKGIRAIRLNLRGCGTGRGLARNNYHGGRTDDLLTVIAKLKGKHPESPISIVGFSLGGNLALKFAGEMADAANHLVEQLITICPPLDLAKSVELLDLPKNRIYQKSYVKQLRQEAESLFSTFPDIPRVEFPNNMSVNEFNELFIAPRSGFKHARDYYKRVSSLTSIHKIKLPCKILFAKDDPFIDHTSLDHRELPKNVEIYKTNQGGHIGYLGFPFLGLGFRWMDEMIFKWLNM